MFAVLFVALGLNNIDNGVSPELCQLLRSRLVGVEVEYASLAILGKHILAMLATEIIESVAVAKVNVVVLVGNLNQNIGVGHHTLLSRHEILRGIVRVGAVPDGTLQNKDGVGA